MCESNSHCAGARECCVTSARWVRPVEIVSDMCAFNPCGRCMLSARSCSGSQRFALQPWGMLRPDSYDDDLKQVATEFTDYLATRPA